MVTKTITSLGSNEEQSQDIPFCNQTEHYGAFQRQTPPPPYPLH